MVDSWGSYYFVIFFSSSFFFLMILYTEETFDLAYKENNKERLRANLAMITREQFRPLFEAELTRELFD
tara:strand:- start:1263 stop:1469 length:207 start_codon:yes stop_codon:yes gene_type:complete